MLCFFGVLLNALVTVCSVLAKRHVVVRTESNPGKLHDVHAQGRSATCVCPLQGQELVHGVIKTQQNESCSCVATSSDVWRQAGLIAPGSNKLSVTYKGTTYTAGLGRSGNILYEGKDALTAAHRRGPALLWHAMGFAVASVTVSCAL